jgi:hypothetical protein
MVNFQLITFSRSLVVENCRRDFHVGYFPNPAFFYCARNPAEPGRAKAETILASIARQLSSKTPEAPLLQPTLDFYGKRQAEAFASGSMRMEESCDLIIQLIEIFPLTTIIIDALDECDAENRRGLLKMLTKILQESSSLVKVFVSSRNDQDIVTRLEHYPNLHITSDRNNDDIAAFVKYQTERLIEDGDLLQYSASKSKMKDLIINNVIEGANGM